MSKAVNGADESSPLLLWGWAPITTRLLKEGGSSAWNYIDGAMMMMNEECFANCINMELETSGLLSKLQPARTVNDTQMEVVANLLAQNAGIATTSITSPPSSSVRGDLSVFVDQQYRKTNNFSSKHPFLYRLTTAIETTVQHHLRESFDFDHSSVQVAEYPGDGVSGYPRHCDVKGNACKHETEPTTTNGDVQRLITVIYYLTAPDWSVARDGGCLRLYENDSSKYTDIAPYADRMVIFRSDCVEHAVQPSFRRPRRAVTVWLYGRKKVAATASNGLEPNRLSPPSQLHRNGRSSPSRALQSSVSRKNDHGPPSLPYSSNIDQGKSSIFVSIAAYRDSETGPTISNLMATARYPQRVYVGLVLQIDTITSSTKGNFNDRRDILEKLPVHEPWWPEQVRVLQLDARHSSGPCPARALGQQLHRGETYMLQIDAHMRFRRNWDTYLIEQLHRCPSCPEKTVLSAYPVGYELPNNVPNETRGTFLLPWKFGSSSDGNYKMLRIRGRLFRDALPHGKDEPVLCHLYAAGFNFSLAASVLKDCPYDGNLHHLFFGEEISMAVRLFTAGYDLYAPVQSVCYHLWSRSHRPPPLRLNHASATKAAEQQRKQSMAVVNDQVLGRGPGLGSARTVSEFAEAIGVNFETCQLLMDDTRRVDTAGLLSNVIGDAEMNGKYLESVNLGSNANSLIKDFLGG